MRNAIEGSREMRRKMIFDEIILRGNPLPLLQFLFNKLFLFKAFSAIQNFVELNNKLMMKWKMIFFQVPQPHDSSSRCDKNINK